MSLGIIYNFACAMSNESDASGDTLETRFVPKASVRDTRVFRRACDFAGRRAAAAGPLPPRCPRDYAPGLATIPINKIVCAASSPMTKKNG